MKICFFDNIFFIPFIRLLLSIRLHFSVFNGVLKWQHLMWLTVKEFIAARENPTAYPAPDFDKEKENAILRQARNKNLSRATYNYTITQQLMAVIRAGQELTSALRVGKTVLSLLFRFLIKLFNIC